jgi:mTERF domain-containing protein
MLLLQQQHLFPQSAAAIAMLHLRKLFSPLLSSTSRLPTPALFSLHRLLATTAPASQQPFAVEDYLVTACGLNRPKAHKAAKKLSHLSPSRIDAVLAFLSALGVSRSGIAAAVAADPQLLCADVDNNLSKRVVELTDLGLSRPQIARLIPLARISFRTSSLAGNLGFWLPVFGSFENILKVLKRNSGLLSTDLDRVAKPNLALFKECGINVRKVSGVNIIRVLTRHPVHVQNAVFENR